MINSVFERTNVALLPQTTRYNSEARPSTAEQGSRAPVRIPRKICNDARIVTRYTANSRSPVMLAIMFVVHGETPDWNKPTEWRSTQSRTFVIQLPMSASSSRQTSCIIG